MMSKSRSGGAGRLVLRVVAGLILFYLVVPIVIVIPLSFSSATYLTFPPPGVSLQWYDKFFGRADWLHAAWLSIWVGLSVTALATALGTPAAIGLVRGRFRGRSLINIFVVSPLVVPVIIVAIGIYFFYSTIRLIGSPLALVFAHTCLAVPFVVVNVSATLYGFDERLECAAMSLGANRWRTFWQVTFPIIRPGILTGALFAFITSFDELIVALFVSGTSAVTLPRKMWNAIRFEIDPTIAAVSTLLVAFTAALFLTAEFVRRRSERLRRLPDDLQPGG
jgi:putative spermidine/putrescine transport system permease protein